MLILQSIFDNFMKVGNNFAIFVFPLQILVLLYNNKNMYWQKPMKELK